MICLVLASLAAVTSVAAAGPTRGGSFDPASPALLRQIVAETALAQLDRIDPRWHPDQRDCAGLVRFAYRAAFLAVVPERVANGPWRDGAGRAIAFADAETLVTHNFSLLGRNETARAQLDSGDLVAFRRDSATEEGPVYHLMLVVRSVDKAHEPTLVVYHPGSPEAALRMGALRDLERAAPREWQPVSSNPFFLGFFRLREWTSHE